MGKTKTKTTSSGTTSGTATTTPNLPGNLQTGLNGIVDKTNQLAGQDPYSLVAGASNLQQQAYTSAGNLGGWQQGIQRSADLAGQVANSPANLAGAYSWDAPTIGSATMAPTMAANVPQLGAAAQAGTTGYTAPQLGPASTYSATLATAPQLGPAVGYTAGGYDPTMATAGQAEASHGTASLGQASLGTASLGQASLGQAYGATAGQASAQGYDARLNGAVGQSEAERAQSVDASGLISKFYNPYEDRVIKSALADSDAQADRVRMQQLAAGAAGGAFGGSRFGVAQAQTEGELQRARDSLDAGIRSQGYTTALGAAQTQAGQDTSVNIGNADRFTANNQFNVGQRNEGQFRDTDAINHAAEFGANAYNTASIGNARNTTDASIASAKNFTDMSEGNANRLSQMSGDNANRLSNMSEGNANRLSSMSEGNANRLSSMSTDNATRDTNVSLGNANNTTAINTTNAAASTGASRDRAQWGNDAGSALALAQNNINIEGGRNATNLAGENMRAINSAAEFGSNAINSNARDNATFEGNARADLSRETNANSRANVAAQNDFAGRQFDAFAQANRDYAGAYNTSQGQQYTGEANRLSDQARLIGQSRGDAALALNNMSQFNAQAMDRQMGRTMDSARMYGDLANTYGSNQRGDIGLQGDLGAQQRDIQQQYLNAPYNQLGMLGDLYRTGAPLIGQTVNENGTNSSSGTQTTSMGMGSMLGGLAGSALSGWASGGFKGVSDRRAKRDIEQVGMTDHGLGLYKYRYLWDTDERPLRTGVMADEVARVAPHAVGPIIGGYNSVDYAALGLSHLVEE